MKHLTTSRKLIALFAIGAILSLCYVMRLRAFTLVELDLLAPVPLDFKQSLGVNVTNISSDPVEIFISVLNAAGTVVETASNTLEANHSFRFSFQNLTGSEGSFSARVGSSAANSIISDVTVFATNGEAVVLVPAVQSVAEGGALYTSALPFLPGQGGAIFITNTGSETSQYNGTVNGDGGGILVSSSGAIMPGQTIAIPFKLPAGKSANAFRGVISNTGGGGSLISDIGAFDKATGAIIAILPGVQLTN